MTNDKGNAKTMGSTGAPLPETVADVSTNDRISAGANGGGGGGGGDDGGEGGSSWAAHSRRRFSRFRSVRKKATSFSGWRNSVKWMTTADDLRGNLETLAKGTYLWKVRRKKLQGVACYRRKYKVCIMYFRPRFSSA